MVVSCACLAPLPTTTPLFSCISAAHLLFQVLPHSVSTTYQGAVEPESSTEEAIFRRARGFAPPLTSSLPFRSSSYNLNPTPLYYSFVSFLPPFPFSHSNVFYHSVLNKITPEKFDSLVRQLLDVGITNEQILRGIIALLFEKALTEPHFSPLYAQVR